MVRRERSSFPARLYESVAQRLEWAAGGTICTRRQAPRARLLLCGLALIVAAGSWQPASSLAQLPTGTPSYNVNAKWVTDRGSQVFNVKAYGATGNGTTDDTAAINATLTAAGVGGAILFPPGNYVVSSQINQGVSQSHQTVWGYGATITCNLSGATDCWWIGSSTSGVPVGTSIYGLHAAGGPNTSQNSAFRVTGTKTHFVDVGGACQISSGSNCYTFGHFIQNDNDMAIEIDHLYDMDPQPSPVSSPNVLGQIITCNASYCGSAVWGSGQNGGAGITYIHNSDLSMNCSGNGIDWGNSNHLTISSTVVQAFSQFGLRTANSTDIDGWTHWEQGSSCVNPLNDGNGHALGGAGVITLGAAVTSEGSAPIAVPGSVFSTSATGGSAGYWYYVVGHTSSGVTAPLLAGYLTNGPSSVSSSAEIFAVWPALSSTGATSYDLLRTPGIIPTTGSIGNWAVATGISASTACGSNGVCAFTDTVGSPTSYTIASATVYPDDTFWPGNLVLFSEVGVTNSAIVVGSYSGMAVGPLVVDVAPDDSHGIHLSYLPGAYVAYPGQALPFGPGKTFWSGGYDYAYGATGGNQVGMYSSDTRGLDLNLPVALNDPSGFVGPLTGNASTATALASIPTQCSPGYAPQGVNAQGNAQNCQQLGGALVTGGILGIGAKGGSNSATYGWFGGGASATSDVGFVAPVSFDIQGMTIIQEYTSGAYASAAYANENFTQSALYTGPPVVVGTVNTPAQVLGDVPHPVPVKTNAGVTISSNGLYLYGGMAANVVGITGQPMGLTYQGTVAASTTTYLGFANAGSATEANVRMPIPYTTTVNHLCVSLATAQPSDAGMTITLLQATGTGSASSTGLSVSIAASAAINTPYCDDTDTYTFTTGATQEADFQITNSSASTSAKINSISVLFSTPSGFTGMIPFPGTSGTPSTASPYYGPWNGQSYGSDLLDVPLPRAATGQDFMCYVVTAPVTNPATFTIRKNKANAAPNVTIGTSATGIVEDTTDTVSFSLLDRLSMIFAQPSGTAPTMGECVLPIN
jgi:hypothetical protein